jgi:hypothetical protein
VFEKRRSLLKKEDSLKKEDCFFKKEDCFFKKEDRFFYYYKKKIPCACFTTNASQWHIPIIAFFGLATCVSWVSSHFNVIKGARFSESCEPD